MTFRPIAASAIAAISIFSGAAQNHTTDLNETASTYENRYGRKLIWSEEFDRTGKPDSTIWNYEHGFVRNNEDQWYQPDNAYVRNGILTIEARNVKEEKLKNPNYNAALAQRWPNKEYIDYTSSCLITRNNFDFQYGTVEVKAKIPTSGGAWPAIWLLGNDAPWPANGEIDIMEYYRIKGVPHILANACWGSDDPYVAIWDDAKIPYAHFTDMDSEWASKFHIWRMDWDENAIKIYLDDELLNEIPLAETVNGKAWENSNAMKNRKYLLVNLALGGINGGAIDDSAFPVTYEIDYIRVYQ